MPRRRITATVDAAKPRLNAPLRILHVTILSGSTGLAGVLRSREYLLPAAPLNWHFSGQRIVRPLESGLKLLELIPPSNYQRSRMNNQRREKRPCYSRNSVSHSYYPRSSVNPCGSTWIGTPKRPGWCGWVYHLMYSRLANNRWHE